MDISNTIILAFSCAVVTFILSLIRGILDEYRLRWKLQALGLSTFQGLPLLGNALQLMKLFGKAPGVPFSVYTLQMIHGFKQAFKDSGLFYYSVGPTCYVVPTRPVDVEAILSSTQEVNKSDEYNMLRDWLGTGLITSNNAKWKKHRKILTPAFHFQILGEFQPIISDYSDILVRKLQPSVGKTFTNLEPYITSCGLDIIAGTALGVDIKAQEGNSPYLKALHNVGEAFFNRVVSPWLRPDKLFFISNDGRKARRNLKVMDEFLKKAIADNKDKLMSCKAEAMADCFDGTSEQKKKLRVPFLEMMLRHNMVNTEDQISDQDILDQVHTFAFAGHDTTTSGIVFTLYLLGRYPEIQERAFQEIVETFGEDMKRPISLDDLKSLSYLERVIKESLRLYPPVPFIARKLNNELLLDGKLLPRGTTVSVVAAILHRDPELFQNPEVFNPDRFLDSNRHPFAYVPFSAGPRNCIGQRFAMLEMKTVVCNILRNYKVTSLDHRDKVLVCSEFICKPGKPIRTRLEFRNTKDHQR